MSLRVRLLLGSACAVASLMVLQCTRAQADVTSAQIGSFDDPVYVTQASGEPSLVFVVKQRGVIRVVRGGRKLAPPFLRIRGIVRSPEDTDAGNEQGLLSMAFPDDYETSRRFYVYFTNNNGAIEVDQFRRSAVDPTVADRSTRKRIIVIPHPDAQNHNGGQLQFRRRALYFATGDGGAVNRLRGEHARDLTSLLGKMIRIVPLAGGGYRIPASNPYVGRPGRDQIFAYGLRNPFRFSFDGTRIAIGDVGQSSEEEVNLLPLRDARGANFGWPEYEGNQPFAPDLPGSDPPTFPIFTYGHDAGACAIIGGYVVRDPALLSLAGRYLYGDLCTGEIRSFIPHVAAQQATGDAPTGIVAPALRSFGEGLNGEIYYAAGSAVYRLTEAP